ncbi:MAG: VOC family protein [Roseitalea sp.]|jgi:predicted enzyme related to lactoylglutathione lyase|nr:VOC family protein [Roseitalea sp.]MBO6722442.1 VOC family protein [Roseitalea sp.]MBO6741944.1 VOC family protein [Roseitalea sp.]
MTNSLASLRIFADALEPTAAFYRDVVGLEEVWASPEVVVFGRDPMIVIETSDDDARSEGLLGRFVGAAFKTEDAEALHRDLTARGVETAGAPERQPWGGILLHAVDPSGNTITFLQDGRTGGN